MQISRMASSHLELNVNLDDIEALNQKRTLAFINHWVYHNVQFLNQFSKICQDRLYDLETKIHRASDALAILECKLSSIPGLDSVVLPVQEHNSQHQESFPNDEQTPPNNKEESQAIKPEKSANENEGLILVSTHPLYAPFFKMANVGVPREAVKLKMSASGLDPLLLDDPSAYVEDETKSLDQESSNS